MEDKYKIKEEKTECEHWTCNGCDKCGGWASDPDVEKACINQYCECHKKCDCIKCDGECRFQEPYGFVPHAGCPIHDFMTEEERKAVVYMDDKETAIISLLNK